MKFRSTAPLFENSMPTAPGRGSWLRSAPKKGVIMRKHALLMLALAALAFAGADCQARPCNQAELAAHKMAGGKGQCFRPDPRPMPHGIAWPGAQASGDSYIYLINSSQKPIKICSLEPEEEGEDPVPYQIAALPPGSYTWDGLNGFADYAFIAGKSRADLDEEREYMRKEGPAVYKFYNLEIRNGKIQYRKVSESEAVNFMKGMKYVKRMAN